MTEPISWITLSVIGGPADPLRPAMHFSANAGGFGFDPGAPPATRRITASTRPRESRSGSGTTGLEGRDDPSAPQRATRPSTLQANADVTSRRSPRPLRSA